MLAVLQLHYLRWVLFDIGGDTYFMYQGIFDTDFDKYTEDAIALFSATGITTIFTKLEGFPEDWKTNAPAFVKFVRDHHHPSFLEYGEYPFVTARRDQEGASHAAGLLRHARRVAVNGIGTDRRRGGHGRAWILAVDDLQHFLVTRTPALAARYEFLSFENADAGRRWLAGMVDKVGTIASVGTSSPDARWVTLAFTHDGLRALGVDDASLATFPEEFREGLAARAEPLGLTGRNPPEHWDCLSRGAGLSRHRHSLRARCRRASARAGEPRRSISRRLAECVCSERWTSMRCLPLASRASTSAISIG